MSTYRTASRLSKPEGRKKIPSGALAYLRTRNRMRVFSLIWKEFQNSGLTQAELAARLGKGTDRVCKILGAPGNWTLDTANDVLFAINGGVLNYSVSYPLDAPKRNDVLPQGQRHAGLFDTAPCAYIAGQPSMGRVLAARIIKTEKPGT